MSGFGFVDNLMEEFIFTGKFPWIIFWFPGSSEKDKEKKKLS